MMFLYFIARSNIHFHFSRLGRHGIQFHALNTFLFVFVFGVEFAIINAMRGALTGVRQSMQFIKHSATGRAWHKRTRVRVGDIAQNLKILTEWKCLKTMFELSRF